MALAELAFRKKALPEWLPPLFGSHSAAPTYHGVVGSVPPNMACPFGRLLGRAPDAESL